MGRESKPVLPPATALDRGWQAEASVPFLVTSDMTGMAPCVKRRSPCLGHCSPSLEWQGANTNMPLALVQSFVTFDGIKSIFL